MSAQTYMRNKLTGEIRDVEPDSQEFRDLQREVASNGLPMWEQTSYAHADAIRERSDFGELGEEDLGHEQQDELRFAALKLDSEGVAPEKNPHLALSPGEVEAGMTPTSKLEDLKQQFEDSVVKTRHKIFDEARDRIGTLGHRGETRGQDHLRAGDGALARAGGSDDRDNVPRPDAGQQSSPQVKDSGPAENGGDKGGNQSPAPEKTPAPAAASAPASAPAKSGDQGA